ncbi:MAG: L-lactate permease, partial [Acidobacteriota bacterium]|nr:L-lactate permease [Acidobacteriota bacterium]
MNLASAHVWPQPLHPVHSLAVSALVAALPLIVVLVLMGVLRRSGLLASGCGLVTAAILAVGVWGMPAKLAAWSVAFGFVYAAWNILWIVFNALWLYHLAIETGSFELLRRWMKQNASGDACIQVMLVAFCFGALLEGTAGFGAPVAVTAFLLVGLGFTAEKAVVVALIADTAPVAFGALGIPIVALSGVTGLELSKLSSMVGRQLPLMSFILPAYMALVAGGVKGLRRSWPAALVAGLSFSSVQFLVSNFWGPYATDIASSLVAIAALTWFLRAWKPELTETRAADVDQSGLGHVNAVQESIPTGSSFRAWWPWVALTLIMIFWSYLKLFNKGQIAFAVPSLHNGVLITLYNKLYAAIFTFQPLATGTAALVATLVAALSFRV